MKAFFGFGGSKEDEDKKEEQVSEEQKDPQMEAHARAQRLKMLGAKDDVLMAKDDASSHSAS